MNDLVFTTYSFGQLYCYQQDRLRESILKIYPDASLMFWKDESGLSTGQEGRPEGSRTFSESMYGFKVHCVKNCLKAGFKKIIFLDAAMILEDRIDEVLLHANRLGVLATIDRTDLSTVISNDCLSFIGKFKTELNLTLVGGSLYIFDFTNPITQKVFDYWAEMEELGLFGNEWDDAHGHLNGHRKDETCMSLALSHFGIEPQGFDILGYHNLGNKSENKKFTFYKLHFKGIGRVHEHSLNQSIIPLHGNILDLGCRDFIFTNFFKNLEYNVVSVDIGKFEGDYHRLAIADKNGVAFCKNERDPDATHISHSEADRDCDEVEMITIPDFSERIGIKHWDLIKMDIEGAELEILRTAQHPIASQICVEFHAHCGFQTKEMLDNLLNMLSEFYHITGNEWKEEHSAGFNYWDVLLIAKNNN